jgi:hypothetical protein
MSSPAELFSIEQSHGKPRLTAPRPTDLGTVETGADRRRDHKSDGTFAPGNQAAVGRSARAAVRAPYLAAEKRISEALASGTEPTESDRLLSDALAVFHAARRELGVSSAFVQGPTIAYSVETILAGFFTKAAADAGFLTERGMKLHERALACEQAAARAMTAALAAAKAVTGKRAPKGANAILAAIEAAGADPNESEEPSP